MYEVSLRTLPHRPQNGQPFSITRPIIQIGLRYKSNTFSGRYSALLDSGADDCVFHAQIGEAIGIDVKSGREKVFGGMGFGQLVGYMHTVEIEVGGHWVQCLVAFSYGLVRPSPTNPNKMEGLPYGILGQEGFFDKFKIIFDRAGEEIELRPR